MKEATGLWARACLSIVGLVVAGGHWAGVRSDVYVLVSQLVQL